MSLLREALPDFSWWRSVDTPREVVAGLIGALLVIPQAITFAYLAGVAPEYGLYCAVFVGFLASLFGNSPMVGGPNTAVSILLGVTVLPFAGRGSPLYTEFVLTLSLMVGLIQLCIWLLRGAAIFRYFSPAAIAGIKVGVGVLLITSALEGALGLSPLSAQFFYEKFYIAFVSWQDLVNPVRSDDQRYHHRSRSAVEETLAAQLRCRRGTHRKRGRRDDLRAARTGAVAAGTAGACHVASPAAQSTATGTAALAVHGAGGAERGRHRCARSRTVPRDRPRSQGERRIWICTRKCSRKASRTR